jgi:hypothetical protein
VKFKIISILTILIILPSLLSCFVTSYLIEDEISCDQFVQNNRITKEFNMEVGDKNYTKTMLQLIDRF